MYEWAAPILGGAVIAALMVLLPLVAYSKYSGLPLLRAPKRFVGAVKSWTLSKSLNRFKFPRNINANVIIHKLKTLASIVRNGSSRLAKSLAPDGIISSTKSAARAARSKFREGLSVIRLSESINRTKLRGRAGAGKLSQLLDGLNLPRVNYTPNGIGREFPTKPDMETLNCRVRLGSHEDNARASDIFIVELCGSIRAPQAMHEVTLTVSITDVTDGTTQTKPVRVRTKQWQIADSPVFCHDADLGALHNETTTLADWTAVAQLSCSQLLLPRKGRRNLQFTVAILSRQTRETLACAECACVYHSTDTGYIDLADNIQRTNTLAVGLAFAVSAADHKLYDCEVDFIKSWVMSNLDASRASAKAERKLEKALDKTVAFFRTGGQFDACRVCTEIAQIAPLAIRYDILEFCLGVARANGHVTSEELALLRNLAVWLELDPDRFRAMLEKTLPVNMHEVQDAETILGVAPNMSKEETRRLLNREYAKWNSRVTSSDPAVQSQADQVLALIADARREYVGLDT
ncbi:MAG: TerB family tellurite resistance protein [Phycisphaerales bacterium]|nr:MAG: TerB family tellurite resistance protein [Phycisphaerales bacterium]